jgi:hypothetical protein
MKRISKHTLVELITGKNPANFLEIYTIDETGKELLYGRYPADKNVKVIASSAACAESLLRLRGLKK